MKQMTLTTFTSSLTLVLFPWVFLQPLPPTQVSDHSVGAAEKRVAAFDVEGVGMLDALLHLGRQEGIPLGIEYLDPSDLEEPLSVHLAGTTVRQAIKAILKQRKGYTWSIQDGVIHIGHTGLPPVERNLLDLRLREFSISGRTTLLTGANLMLPAQLKRQVHPPEPSSAATGVVGSVNPGRIENQVGPLKLRNVTVRQVLNRLVSKHNNAAWVALAPPTRLNRLPQKGLWYVIEYNAPQDQWTDFIRTLLLENWPREASGQHR